MIKKIYALTLICSVLSLRAEHSSPWLEIKPGYFHFSDNTLRKIYDRGFEIQTSGTLPLWKLTSVYGSLGYLHAKGTSLYGAQKTSISQFPLDLGLRISKPLNQHIECYISAGPRWFIFHQYNDSPYIDKNIYKKGVGFFINTGWNIIRNDRWIIGAFGEYGFGRKSFTSSLPNVYGMANVPIGGFTVGVSLGLVF